MPAIEFPGHFFSYLDSNWDYENPIHVNAAIILWCDVNPHDLEARKSASNEIKKIIELFLAGKRKGYLSCSIPPSNSNPPDQKFYLTRKELKTFAKKVRKKPLFLFPIKDKKKKYNIPPKPSNWNNLSNPPKPGNWSNPSFSFPGDADSYLEDEWEHWTVGEFFWMFFGDPALAVSDHPLRMGDQVNISPPRREIIKEIFGYFKTSLQAGWFGRFGNEYEGADLVFHSIHPLRIIDWLEEHRINSAMDSHGFRLHPKLKNLIQNWSGQRDQIKGHSHVLDFEKLAKRDVWARHELQLILFGEFYAQLYPSWEYHQYNPALERLKHRVDQEINQAMAGKRITIPTLELNFGGESTTFGFLSQELLKELNRLEYPVPKGLIASMHRGDWAKAEKFLRELHENIKGYVNNSGKSEQKHRRKEISITTTKAKQIELGKELTVLMILYFLKNPTSTLSSFMEGSEPKKLIRKYGFTPGKYPAKSTLERYAKNARVKAGAERKPGRRAKG